MTEIFSFADGELHLYTGSHTASGNPIAFVNNVNGNKNVVWQSDAAVDGTYRSHYTDERADFSFQLGWMQGEIVTTLFEARTALHVKVTNVNPGLGSAGIMLYSAVLNTQSFGGGQGGVMGQTVNGFCHSWSAF